MFDTINIINSFSLKIIFENIPIIIKRFNKLAKLQYYKKMLSKNVFSLGL